MENPGQDPIIQRGEETIKWLLLAVAMPYYAIVAISRRLVSWPSKGKNSLRNGPLHASWTRPPQIHTKDATRLVVVVDIMYMYAPDLEGGRGVWGQQ